jgi:hypothetical protein
MNLIKHITDILLDFLISPPQKKYSAASRIGIGLLFLAGIYLWGHFFNWGTAPIGFHDWPNVADARLSILKAAILTGQIPLHANIPVLQVETLSTRILSIPDLIISPQILLLKLLDIGQFAFFQVIFLFSLGFLGLLRLRKDFRFSLLAFTIIFLLFNFNGQILAHFSVGHLNWGGYFLLPWFAILIFELLQGKSSWLWILEVAFLLLFIFIQGSYHHFIYLLLFIGLMAISFPEYFWPLVKAGVLSVLLSMFRLLPPTTLFGKFHVVFIAGYPTIQSFLQALVQNEPYAIQRSINGLTTEIGNWEVTFYLGIIGTLFLLYFGLVRPLIGSEINRAYRKLWMPILVMTLLSFDLVYRLILKVIPIPPISGERVATRFFPIAFVFLLILAANEFQNWLNSPKPSRVKTGTAVAGLAFLVIDLLDNYFHWTIPVISQQFTNQVIDLSKFAIANDYNDKLYINLVILGSVISILTLGFMAIMVWHEKRKHNSAN